MKAKDMPRCLLYNFLVIILNALAFVPRLSTKAFMLLERILIYCTIMVSQNKLRDSFRGIIKPATHLALETKTFLRSKVSKSIMNNAPEKRQRTESAGLTNESL